MKSRVKAQEPGSDWLVKLEELRADANGENDDYLSKQIITYIGNKRALLDFIGSGVKLVQRRLGKEKLDCVDIFSGSGIVARYLKRFARVLYVNDLEAYSAVTNRCYLANRQDFPQVQFDELYADIKGRLAAGPLDAGFIAELYAPADDERIRPGERVFFTARNARYIDTARRLIESVPEPLQPFFLAPLLAEASVHANTAGVFKGFYKNRENGVGQFGGNNRDAQSRIRGDIDLMYPVLSAFSCESQVFQEDANALCASLPDLDFAYLDPPYNQHPYGSNYFMLNLIAEYKRPSGLSLVSGIPKDWKRSRYNKRRKAASALFELARDLKAKFLLVSFNSEGFITPVELEALLRRVGRVKRLETKYNAFRGSRNLSKRPIHVKEYLYLVEKN